MKKVLKNEGITLVALVITIIILIILASISFTILLGDNGLIEKSKDAVDRYNQAAIEEQQELNNVNDIIDSIISGIETPSQNNNPNGGENTPTTYTAYSIGQEVIVGGERFYVLEDSDSSQSTVTLLAKYNLNKEGTAQAPNANCEDTAAVFSSDKYWASAFAAYTDWSTDYFDINTVSGEVEGDAIYKAKAYATSKGGTNGRLLTVMEAYLLETSYGDMIWGKANTQTSGNCLYYWLSSASMFNNDEVLATVRGDNERFSNHTYNYNEFLGVRPVITVNKSLVSIVQ